MPRRTRVVLAVVGVFALSVAIFIARPRRPDVHDQARAFLAGYRFVSTGRYPGAFGVRAPITVVAGNADYGTEIVRGARFFSSTDGWGRSLPPNTPRFIHVARSPYESLFCRVGLINFAAPKILFLSPKPRKGGGCELIVNSDRGDFTLP